MGDIPDVDPKALEIAESFSLYDDATLLARAITALLREREEDLIHERDVAREEFKEARNTSYLERAQRAEAALGRIIALIDKHFLGRIGHAPILQEIARIAREARG